GSSNSQPQGPPPHILTVHPRSEVPLPPHLQPMSEKFFREENMKRYAQIKAFNLNQEKGFADDLLRGVPEISEELHRRKWVKFNSLIQKVEAKPGNATLAREFFANAYKLKNERHDFKSFVRGVEIDFSADAINAFFGTSSREKCVLIAEKRRVESMLEPERRLIKDFPIARAWAEFWVKNVEVVGNSSEYQVDNAAAVKVILEKKFVDLGHWLSTSLDKIASNPNGTFNLGHCSLISALCRAKKVRETDEDGGFT
ncbi:hypothetical protein A2U01_0014589, partial [Trifolium medium]|nr:hypothetical protein [Trifolium medium]